MKKVKLNLGAGKRIDKDAINHDIWKHSKYIECVYDLNIAPWAIWKDNQFQEITAISVLEHLKLTLVESANELHRIVKPSGVVRIKYPTKTSETIHDDPTHRWFWSQRVLEFLDPDTEYGQRYDFYPHKKWRIIDLRVNKNRSVVAELTPRGK